MSLTRIEMNDSNTGDQEITHLEGSCHIELQMIISWNTINTNVSRNWHSLFLDTALWHSKSATFGCSLSDQADLKFTNDCRVS
jgi:hypothetical protein